MEGNVLLHDFIEVKGWKALGNKLSDRKLTKIKAIKQAEPEKENDKDADSQPNLFN